MGVQHGAQNRVCDRKEMIKRIRRVIDDLDNSNVETRCCCSDPKKPPAGTRVVATQVLDGKEAVPRLEPSSKEKYIWIPPHMDTRQLLDHTMACHSTTVANQFYDHTKGCKLDCGEQVTEGVDGGPSLHSHWWNAPRASMKPQGGMGPDYCEDPSFVPPEPLGHMAWTNEPGGTCKHPQYCKAHCFDHTPERDWSRNH